MSEANITEPVTLAKSLVEESERAKSAAFGGFLGFEAQRECVKFLAKSGVRFELSGGYPYAARRVLGVDADAEPLNHLSGDLLRDGTISPSMDFPISAVKVRPAASDRRISPKHLKFAFSELDFPDYAFGDFALIGGESLAFVIDGFAGGVKDALTVVGGTPVLTRVESGGAFKDYMPPDENAVIASARVDAAISAIFRISREDSSLAVKNEMVRINYEPALKPSAEIRAGDVLELETRGRARAISLDETAKGRIRVIFHRY